ncbi:hypothetical protein PCANB_000123 [Pneumocystis canis]|nr:hypothetical protein PCK1_000070 [Pneumocystis canis]KAG5439841.1 hypothetical protein PCANB_000123 [Pneumocystis canis]
MNTFPCKKEFYKDILDKNSYFNDEIDCQNGFEPEHIHSKHFETYQDDWYPKIKYIKVTINALSKCIFPIALTGRIVNIYQTNIQKNVDKSVIIIYLKDDKDVIKVKYWSNNKNTKSIHHMLAIDTLCTVFATQLYNEPSTCDSKSASTVPFYLAVSDNNKTTHLSIFKDQHKCYRTPLKIQKNDKIIHGLMSLLTFINGGNEAISKPKILVSIQKIGNLEIFNTKKGVFDKIELKVFDDTYDAIFILWGSCAKSATLWTPFDTILLLTDVSLSFHYGKAYLTFQKHSIIEVNPDMDVKWVRNYSSVMKSKLLNIPKLPFIEDETVNTSFTTMFYTLAEIDNTIRSKPKESIVGFINVLITETAKLSVLRSSNKIFVGECCGKIINSSNYDIKCSICSEKMKVFSNSFIIKLLDESAQLLYPMLSSIALIQLLETYKELFIDFLKKNSNFSS